MKTRQKNSRTVQHQIDSLIQELAPRSRELLNIGGKLLAETEGITEAEGQRRMAAHCLRRFLQAPGDLLAKSGRQSLYRFAGKCLLVENKRIKRRVTVREARAMAKGWAKAGTLRKLAVGKGVK